MKKLLPNACTSLNLVFGMCSLMFTFYGDLQSGAFCIFLALVADGMDGRIARFFGVSSELGKEMDSLCDLGSFGIAPAMLAYKFCLNNFGYLGAVVAILFALCGMWRLARFNVNTDKVHGYFMGLAIPAGACVIAATTLLFLSLGTAVETYGYVYPILVTVVAYLMISTVHYPDFKGKGETIYLKAKIISVVIFVAIVFWGRDSLPYALVSAFFCTYAIFGIINSLCALFAKEDGA